MKLLIKNIKQIIGISDSTKSQLKKGKELKKINSLNDGWILLNNDLIVDFGNMDNWIGIDDWNNIEIIDANQGIVMPTFCDSHTHIVYSQTREKEFVDRIQGLTYEEIAKNGGGILNSAKTLANTSESELYDQSVKRLNRLIKLGTGAIEIKSGYGLEMM